MPSGPRPSPSAENVAAARALLTKRGIVDDVDAERFVGRRKRVTFGALTAVTGPGRVFPWIAARTPFYDHVIQEALDEGLRHVVIVGAGYDTRAWRLARAGVRFIEIDHPVTQARKRALARSGGPEYVPADLEVQRLGDVLGSHVAAGEPFVIICEGLTYFLAADDVRSLLSEAAKIAPDRSRLGVDFGPPPKEAALRWRVPVAVAAIWQWLSREPIRFYLHPDDAPAFLAECGWGRVEVLTQAVLRERFLTGTDVPQPPALSSFACTAVKQ